MFKLVLISVPGGEGGHIRKKLALVTLRLSLRNAWKPEIAVFERVRPSEPVRFAMTPLALTIPRSLALAFGIALIFAMGRMRHWTRRSGRA